MVVINITENLLENIEFSESHTIKILQRENSVNKYYVELKDDALTKRGYFDLVRVPDLYVTGAGSLFKSIREKNGLKQKDTAKIFMVSDIYPRTYIFYVD